MLRASWQRSQRVARRRIAWRWLLWYTPRYLLPGLALCAAVVGLWYALRPAPSPGVAALPPAATPPAAQGLNAGPGIEAGAAAPEPAGMPTLTLERSWGTVTGARAPATGLPAATDPKPPTDTTLPIPLKPDNWLHSKEP